MQPLEHIYIRLRPKRTQPAEIVAYQGKQYTIFSLNAGNGDVNGTSSTGIWSWMGLQDLLLQRSTHRDDFWESPELPGRCYNS